MQIYVHERNQEQLSAIFFAQFCLALLCAFAYITVSIHDSTFIGMALLLYWFNYRFLSCGVQKLLLV